MTGHAPGWYPDPFRRFELRWFNGSSWTADVSTGGQRMVDPLGTQPTPTDALPGHRPVAAKAGNGFGITAMILGIVAITIAWIPFAFVAGAVCAVLALIFGIVARRRRADRKSSPAAMVGLILGPIALLFAVGGFVLTRVVLDVVRPGKYEITSTSCDVQDGRQVYEGTIRNDSGRTRSYTIHVEFVRAGTDSVMSRASTEVYDVPSGGTAPWTVSVRAGSIDLDCRVATVVGTFDFLGQVVVARTQASYIRV